MSAASPNPAPPSPSGFTTPVLPPALAKGSLTGDPGSVAPRTPPSSPLRNDPKQKLVFTGGSRKMRKSKSKKSKKAKSKKSKSKKNIRRN